MLRRYDVIIVTGRKRKTRIQTGRQIPLPARLCQRLRLGEFGVYHVFVVRAIAAAAVPF